MFDPYHRWLAIPPDQRPPTYYQLLGIAPDEADSEVIEEASLRQTSHVRLYQTGPQSAQCTAILNEIGQARATLLNPEKRRRYDASLEKARAAIQPPVDAGSSGAMGPSPLLEWEPVAPGAAAASQGRDRGRARSRGSPVLPAVGYALLLLLGAGLAFGVGLSGPASVPEQQRTDDAGESGSAAQKSSGRDAGEILEGHEAAVRALAVSPDGVDLFSAGGDYTAGTEGEPIGCALRQWDPRKPRLVRLFVGPRAPVHCLALSPDGKQLLAGSGGGSRWRDGTMAADDCVVRLWNLKDGEEKLTFTEQKAPVRGVAFLPNDKFAVSCSSDGVVLLWDVGNPAMPTSLASTLSPTECLAVSPGGKHLVVGGSDGRLRLWTLGGTPKEFASRFASGKEPIYAVAFSPNGKFLASAGGRLEYKEGKLVGMGCVVRLWNVETGKRVDGFSGHTRPIRALAWRRDERLVSGSLDGTVRVWDVKEGQLERSIEAGSGVTCVALPAKQRRLIAGTLSGTIRIWDLDRELSRGEGRQ